MAGYYFMFFFKQKTAYEMRISDWSSDVCSSDLRCGGSRAGSASARVHERGTGRADRERSRSCEIRRIAGTLAAALCCDDARGEIGRAAWRERVCQYV